MTAATADPGKGRAEVTGLASAQAYAAGMRQALASAAAGTEMFAAGLDGYGVHGAAAAAVARAQELTGQASAAWVEVVDALDRQTAVAEAYHSAPDAGGKQFLTGSAASAAQAPPVSEAPSAAPSGGTAAEPGRRWTFRLIDLMCDRHRDLIVETRIWPPGYQAGNHWPGLNPCCPQCGAAGRRQPNGRADILPGTEDHEHTAYHEAGHVIACHTIGAEIDYATIEHIGENQPRGHVAATLDSDDQCTEDHLLVLLAGQAAARRWLIEERQLDDAALVDVVKGSSEDLADALDDGWTRDEISAALAVADAFIDRNWDSVELVADLLLARGRLAGPELDALLRGQQEVVAASLAAVRATETMLEALTAVMVHAALSQTHWARIGGVAGIISAVLAFIALVVAIAIG